MLVIGCNSLNDNEIYNYVYINGIKTNYIVSTYGNVYNIKTGNLLKPFKLSKGYLGVNIFIDGKSHTKKVHRLVAEAFIPNPYNKSQVNHIDGDKTNNNITNLEWCTCKENCIHAEVNNLRHHPRGENNGFSKYTEKQIHHVCKLIESAKFSLYEISILTGVSYGSVKVIKNGKEWNYISNNYNISNFDKKRKKNRRRFND